MSTSTCGQCARHENSIGFHSSDLRRLAYVAQSTARPGAATKAKGEIPKARERLRVARQNLAEHREVDCTAVDRISTVS